MLLYFVPVLSGAFNGSSFVIKFIDMDPYVCCVTGSGLSSL